MMMARIAPRSLPILRSLSRSTSSSSNFTENRSVTGLGSSSSAGGAVAQTKAEEKVLFDVKLEKVERWSKVYLIKELRNFTGLYLKECKDLVENVPVVVKKGVTKEEAEAIKAKLKELDATVVFE